MRCSLFWVIACQPAIKGMLRNMSMSLLKTRLPALLPKVECTPALMPCMVINDIPYMFFCISNLSPYILYWQLVPICLAICPHIFVHRIFPIAWCILLQIALDWGLLAAGHTSLMWHFWESFSILELWKKQTNKQTYKQQLWLVFWFGILAWDLELGSWTGTSNASSLLYHMQYKQYAVRSITRKLDAT